MKRISPTYNLTKLQLIQKVHETKFQNELMKKVFIILLVMVAVPFVGIAQTAQPKETAPAGETQFFMGLNGGLDYDINAFKLDRNEIGFYSYYGIRPRYNIGFDLGLKVSKKLRYRIEMKYVNVKYGINYDSIKNSSNTVLNVNYFDFNFHLDYLWLTKGNFQLFISPALKYEFETGETMAGPNYNTTEIIHPSSVVGGALSAIAKYNFSKHFGLTLTPEYTYFFHAFTTGNSKPYQRFSSNLGVEFKF